MLKVSNLSAYFLSFLRIADFFNIMATIDNVKCGQSGVKIMLSVQMSTSWLIWTVNSLKAILYLLYYMTNIQSDFL